MRLQILVFAILLQCIGVVSARQPNVVFILADDLGWRDVGCYGSTYHKTPNIDALAARGTRFTQAYTANPLCSPTRASIMTGLYPARIGITSASCHQPDVHLTSRMGVRGPPENKSTNIQSATRLDTKYVTLAETLKAAGYRTGHFGKWHLGAEPYSPLEQGFDVDVPHYSGPAPAGSYVAPWKFPPKLNFTGEPGEHIEDRMANEAVKFIEANKDRPFFLNYWAFSVHTPIDAKNALIEEYEKQADPNSPQRHPVYAAMVHSLDDAVGTLMKALEANGLLDNTIVVFFADNGGVNWPEFVLAARLLDSLGMKYFDTPPTSNVPLRGGKATLYEGGVRVPCIVAWPGVVEKNATSDAIIQSIDFHPTLAAAVGASLPPDHKFDGSSFLPVLKGEKSAHRDTVFNYFPQNSPKTGNKPCVTVRRGDLKLIRYFHDADDGEADRHELYNLQADLSEANDLAAAEPEKVKELNTLIDGFLQDTGALIPKSNPAWRGK